MFDLLLQASLETIVQVSFSVFVGLFIGLPLAIGLWITKKDGLRPCSIFYRVCDILINVTRSIPYLILIVLMMPMTRFLVGSSIGVWASSIPLAIAAILLIARVSDDVFKTIPKGLIEAGKVMGATHSQIVKKILLPESLPALVSNLTTVVINIIGFSAMAGAVGGGGLGDLAIRYGYQRYDFGLLFAIVVVLVILVQCVQLTGDIWAKNLKK